MRICLLFSVVLMFLRCATFSPLLYSSYEKTASLSVSDKVGATIEPEERDRYKLFHNVKDFRSATFYGLKGGGYEVEIKTDAHKYIALNRDTMGIHILRDYINNFDTIKDSMPGFKKKWKILDYDTLGQPITGFEAKRSMQNACCCALGLGAVGAIMAVSAVGEIAFWLFNFFAGGPESSAETRAIIGGAGYGLVGFVTGVVIDGFQEKSKIAAIKQARKPRLVE